MGNNINLCDSVVDIISLILWILLIMLLVTMCSGNKFMHRFLPIGFVESKWKYFLISFILAFVLIFFLLLVCIFNDGEFFWIVNKNISTEWETWGGFATCLSAIFTLITVFYAYTAFTNSNRALKSQQKAAERASFDATFTQMFAQHNILYAKNRCLRHKHCHFAEFVGFFERMSVKQDISISKIWSKYNEVLDCGCGAGCSSNFKNYFKYIVSIRPTTGIKPLYTTIATVTMNLIVSAAIVLLNPYVTVYISYKIPPFALSVHIPDVSTSIYVEVDSKVLLGLPFCDKASGRLHHSGTPLGLHRVPYR